MYNVSQLKTGFQSLVGTLQSNLPQVPQISAPLTDSLSGIYVQDKHSLVTLENVWYAAPNFSPQNWNNWVSGSNYVLGYVVNVSGVLYRAKVALTNDIVSPPSDPTNWEVYDPFQNWLLQKYNQAITNLFAEVVKRKKLMNMGKAIMERQQLYRGGGNIQNLVISDDSFVGYEFNIQSAEGLIVLIDEIGIQSTETQAEMDFYLYHTDNKAYLGKWTLPIADSYTFSWQKLLNSSSPAQYNCIMEYMAQNTTGSYIFGYYQRDLTGQAISKQWDCSTSPCIGCNSIDLNFYNQWSRWTTMRNVKVPASALQFGSRDMFDTNAIVYGNMSNWGMNLSMTVRCDLTRYILYSKYLFADAFAMQYAKELLDVIAKNARLDPIVAKIQTKAAADLDIRFPGSWVKSYYDSIDALNLDMSGFSKVCMPCDNTKKMKWRTI